MNKGNFYTINDVVLLSFGINRETIAYLFVFCFVSKAELYGWLIFFLKNKVNLVLRNKKNICSLYKHKVKGTDIKITTRTYDKNGKGC